MNNNRDTNIQKIIIELSSQRNQDLLTETLLNQIIQYTGAKSIQLYLQDPIDTESNIFHGFKLSQESPQIEEMTIASASINQNDFVKYLIESRQKLFTLIFEKQKENIWEENYAWLSFWKVKALLRLTGNKKTDYRTADIETILNIYSNLKETLDTGDRDSLTKLYNRKIFDYRFNTILEQSMLNKKKQLHYFLAIFDVDHFKSINDTYGHLYGDEVLIRLANIMRKSFKKRDFLFRFGGEEFVVLIDADNINLAEKVFDRFREQVSETEFPQIKKVTVSVGLSQISHTDEAIAVINRADQALYVAKHNGRNRTYSYEALLKEGKIKEETRPVAQAEANTQNIQELDTLFK